MFFADGSVVDHGYRRPFVDRGGLIKWSKLLADLGEVSSTSEAERVMKQNGFEVDGRLIVDPTTKLDVDQPRSYQVRIGKKKFLRIIIDP